MVLSLADAVAIFNKWKEDSAEVLVVTPRLALPLASRPAKTIREMDMTDLRGRPCRPAVARGQQIKLLTL